jgi:hypothetical protein
MESFAKIEYGEVRGLPIKLDESRESSRGRERSGENPASEMPL